MKRVLGHPLVLAGLALLVSGCVSRYSVPVVRATLERPKANKIPLRVAVDVPEREDVLTTRTWAIFTVPDGELMNDLAEELFPHLFKRAQIGTFKTFPTDTDAILRLSLSDVKITQEEVALGFGLRHSAELLLHCTLYDPSGKNVLDKSVRGVNEGRAFVSPFIPVEKLMGETFSSALADAYQKLGDNIANSDEIHSLVASHALPGAVGPSEPDGATTASKAAENSEKAKEILKDAFERGFLTADQLTRALDELKTEKQTRTLTAFLRGELDGKRFGSIY